MSRSHDADGVISFRAGAHVKSLAEYQKLYDRSLHDADAFWREQAQTLSWFQPFTSTSHGSFEQGDVAWFLNGRLNACYNAVDRHVEAGRGDKVAILFEGDEPSDVRRMTYRQLQTEVSKCANALRRLGVTKGKAVCLYMPMVPAAAVAMLACARIGAPHSGQSRHRDLSRRYDCSLLTQFVVFPFSVVFAGFSADALRDRILDGHCDFVITADEGRRGGKAIPLKSTVDRALSQCPNVKACLVYQHTGALVEMKAGRDLWWAEALAAERGYAPCESMDSEDTLFYLFTSGSTGRPKGIQHSTAGYLLHATLSTKYIFDLHEDDIHCCAADIGWVRRMMRPRTGSRSETRALMSCSRFSAAAGDGTFLHRLRPADPRRDDVHVRVDAAVSRSQSLLADGGASQADDPLHRSNRDPCAHEIPGRASEEVRSLQPARARIGRRADQPGGVEVVLRCGWR